MSTLSSTTTISGGSIAKSRKPEPQIPLALSRLNNQICNLEEFSMSLESRLVTVMRSADRYEAEKSGQKSEITETAPLAVDMFSFAERLRVVNDRLLYITNRLELGE